MGLVLNLLSEVIGVYKYVLLIYIFMSWFPNARASSIGQFFAKICEPYLEPFRKIIPSLGMIDISPLIAFYVLYLAQVGIGQINTWI